MQDVHKLQSWSSLDEKSKENTLEAKNSPV